ncbi:MAG: FecR family protein [Bacteroidota bacterium]
MTNKKVIPNYDLFAKYFATETNTHETKELENWVNESSENKKSFDRMYFLWMQSAKKDIEQKANSNLAWGKLQNRIHSPKNSLKIIPKKQNIYLRTAKNLLKVAAVLFSGFLIGYFVENYTSQPQYLTQETSVNTSNLVLADQTSVKLNKNSKLTYPDKFKKDKRLVKLNGEAFFKVKHDKEKPFIVETKIARIKVLGTSFNVKTLNTINRVSVTVQSGKVELSGLKNQDQKLILIKGETGIIDNKNGFKLWLAYF